MTAHNSLEKNVKFDFIRYSNCWEDAEILLDALSLKKSGRYLSIASSGDNSLSLLKENPSLVLAIDLSLPQIACTELRKYAVKSFTRNETLEFLGMLDSGNRMKFYDKIKNFLSHESKSYWENNLALIEKGIAHSGKFENYFRLFRKFILPFILSGKNIQLLMKEKDKEARIKFYKEILDTWRWRLLFKIFFSKKVMGSLGRDPEFFKYAQKRVAEKIMSRARYALTEIPAHDNPYLEYILLGNFRNALPYYLRESNYEKIQKNIDNLEIVRCNISEAFSLNKSMKFDGYNLSDIFEYMNQETYLSEVKQIIEYSNKGARLVYWNMMVKRETEGEFPDSLVPKKELAEKLYSKNKAFFYDSLVIEEVK